MKLLHEIGLGECLSCGAKALDVAIYLETSYGDDEGTQHQCCKMCAYKTPWHYGPYGSQTRVLMETALYIGNVIRMDMRK